MISVVHQLGRMVHYASNWSNCIHPMNARKSFIAGHLQIKWPTIEIFTFFRYLRLWQKPLLLVDLCCHLKCRGTRIWNLNCKSKSSQPTQPKYGGSCLVNFETCKIKEIVNLKDISIGSLGLFYIHFFWSLWNSTFIKAMSKSIIRLLNFWYFIHHFKFDLHSNFLGQFQCTFLEFGDFPALCCPSR